MGAAILRMTSEPVPHGFRPHAQYGTFLNRLDQIARRVEMTRVPPLCDGVIN
jgi:hypothetical protein